MICVPSELLSEPPVTREELKSVLVAPESTLDIHDTDFATRQLYEYT